jgi:Flp pilus assembly pilin Flp
MHREVGGFTERIQAPSAEGLRSVLAGPMTSESTRRTVRRRLHGEVCNMRQLYTLLIREDGQTMAEYGVVLAVITIGVLGALVLLSGGVVNALTRVAGFIG